jgi:hypothetical protein
MKKTVLILLILCCLIGCRTKQQTISERTDTQTRVDSVSLIQKVTVTPVVVPESTVRLDLSIDELEALPPGAKYTEKDGQATVTVLRTETGYEVSANCDSLTFLLTEKETEIYHLNRQITELSEKLQEQRVDTIREPTPFQWFQIWAFRFLLLIIILIFILKKFNVWQRITTLLLPNR